MLRIAGLVETTGDEIDVIPLPLFLSNSHSPEVVLANVRGGREKERTRERERHAIPLHPLFYPRIDAVHRCIALLYATRRHEGSQQETTSVHARWSLEGVSRWRGGACKRGVMHFARSGTAAKDRAADICTVFLVHALGGHFAVRSSTDSHAFARLLGKFSGCALVAPFQWSITSILSIEYR